MFWYELKFAYVSVTLSNLLMFVIASRMKHKNIYHRSTSNDILNCLRKACYDWQ